MDTIENNILTEEKRKEIIYLLSSMINTINNMANDINNYGDTTIVFCCSNFEWRFAEKVQNMIKYLNEIK